MLKVSNNYGIDGRCPLCKIAEDSQQHLIECLVIKASCPDILYNTNCKYEDLFNDNITKQNDIIKLIEVAIRKRMQILEN